MSVNVFASGPIIPINKAFNILEREKKQAIENAAKKEKEERQKLEKAVEIVKKAGVKKSICAFYNKPKGCTKSDEECGFLHLKTAVMPKVLPKVFEKKSPCLYFNTPKGCNKGDECTFIHEKGNEKGNEKGEKEVTKKFVKMCDYFNTPNGCWKKDKCPFVHQMKDSEYEPMKPTQSTTQNWFGSDSDEGDSDSAKSAPICSLDWKLDRDEQQLFNEWTSEWTTVSSKKERVTKKQPVVSEPVPVDISLCSLCSLQQATVLYDKEKVCVSCHNEKSEMMDLEEEAYHRVMSEICSMCVKFCGGIEKMSKINEEMAYVTPTKKFNIARITTNQDEANEFFAICPTTVTVNKFTFGSASLLMNKMFHAILREKLSSMCERAHFMIKSEHDYVNSTTILYVAAKKRYDI